MEGVTKHTQQGAISHGQAARLNNTTTAIVVATAGGQVMSSLGLPAHGMLGANSHTAFQSKPMIGGLFTPCQPAILPHKTPRLRSPLQPTAAANQPLHTQDCGRKMGSSKPKQRKGLFIRQFTRARRATITSLCRPLTTQEEVALHNQLLPKQTKGSKTNFDEIARDFNNNVSLFPLRV